MAGVEASAVQSESLSEDLKKTASSDEACARLQQIPGVGPLVATAVVSAIGNGAAFHKGREFAVWLGLVPRQWSTGGKSKLLGISKRGNPYLRKIVHPRSPRCGVARQTRRSVSGTVDEWLGNESRPQRPDRCHCEQAGEDQLGSVVERRKLSPATRHRCRFQLDEVGSKFASQKSANE